MHPTITGHHVDVTPALRDRVATKMERLKRHFDHVNDIHVTLSVEKQRHQAEATVNVSGAKLHASSVESDMYAAIDSLTDKLDRQIRKHKEKMTDHHARDADKSKFA
ncbi:MAG: ribosome-associated translation inhibitor RaiA [Gammaproteobacteria bacterium]|nr:ribosome-associated translation inhibitor RaiA [Gammaproteobacteria bacterium]NNF62447.1 ribosome-associated translation inhibitor RaiA [Gammaproteobacteria bacterium]NNM21394.1 ribosome-associated translation inhibitor RaiA [Gammaproteobacteria bacterium]